jgi:Ca-activated chloride channel homolog
MKKVLFNVLVITFGFFGILPAAADVDISVEVSHPVLYNETGQKFYLKVGLTGSDVIGKERTPVNLALVLDRSGSMSGEKIINARKAVSTAVGMLGSKDILSFITYADGVNVMIPASPVSNQGWIESQIQGIQAGGSTALFSGVSWGASEVRKFRDSGRVNRVILLSDGLANIGPSTPGELGSFGGALKEEGISVTTIGLGLDYNEDLMFQLAKRSDGNHYFVQEPADLPRIFLKEFQNTLSVAAQNVSVRIVFSKGIRPLRSLGREAEIIGNTVYTEINQVYGNNEKYLLLELSADGGFRDDAMKIADVTVEYTDTQTTARRSGYLSPKVSFTADREKMEQNINGSVMTEVVLQIAALNSEEALHLRDAGKVDAAKKKLLDNVMFLQKNARELDSEELSTFSEEIKESSKNLEPGEWEAQRKELRSLQYGVQNQQEQ